MSQGYHHGNNIYSFPNGFERSEHQQILREKLGGGISASDENSDAGIPNVYDTAGMLSEMFSYPATQLLHQMGPPGYQQNPRQPQPQPPVTIQEWYSDRKDPNILEFRDVSSSVHSVHVDQHQQRQDNQQQQLHHMSDISVVDSAASAMQLFLMNPQSRTPSSSPGQVSSTSHINTLQMLLPNNTNTSPFNSWGGGGGGGGKVQGLSLSLASSLEAAKAEQLFFTQHHQQFQQQQQGTLHFNHQMNINNGIFVGPSSTLSSMNILRNSKYAKPTQELLEEFCSVGRGHFKKNKFKNNLNPSNTDKDQTEATTSGAGGGASLSSATKEGSTAPPPPTLSAAERAEHQRKKVKLLAMLDEVDRRYSHYCEQMQLVVNSFDLVMGFGSAMPYTALAQKAMSRHFRCLKDTIAAQLKRSCELLGEKDAAASGGVTKGETPRLRIIEQSLRQQRAFHQMGMMETEAWRPQRGLPERSVNILRAWLFENFLHPYPSDADKHLLARQTGLSRSQVSNWFINARVRLWKPMVEEMYQQEAKEEDQASDQNLDNNATSNNNDNMNDDQNDLLDSSSQQQDHTRASSSSHHFSTPHQAHNMIIMSSSATQPQDYYQRFHVEMMAVDDDRRRHRESGSSAGTVLSTTSVGYIGGGPGLIRFGTTTAAGDVSLTLGLRQHSGNLPEKDSFSVREFGGC